MSGKLIDKKCGPCHADTPPLTSAAALELLAQLNEWVLDKEAKSIKKKFSFKNFYVTMAFANAVAWVANQENHHPDLHITYNTCVVSFSTHAIHGLSENDFICAKKVDLLTV